MKFLIISDLVDIKNKKISHYSLDKGLNLGIGLNNNGHSVDYIVSCESYIENNINFINYEIIKKEEIDLYDYVIIVREAIIQEILEKFVELKKIFFSEKRNTKIIIKSDSPSWIVNKEFRKYVSSELKINASTNSITKWVNNNIDVICVQNSEMYKVANQQGIYKNKLLITNMAVPNEQIDYDNIENPYLTDYSYCKNKNSLTPGTSLFPLFYENNPDKINELTLVKRKKIIYIGRIKTDSGKIIYQIKEIIEKLGDMYELHIFPGSFVIYNNDSNTIESYSSNNSNHLVILRDQIFPENKNVFIHSPFNHADIHKYLWHADIGIDFSSTRPLDVKTTAGNAKLLEYCYLGLPVVSESNVNNAFLVANAKNGILIDGIGSTDDYVNSIKNLEKISIDRKQASKITIQNENWDVRAKYFVEDLEQMFRNNEK